MARKTGKFGILRPNILFVEDPFCRSARFSRATSTAPSLRAIGPPDPRSTRASQPTRHLQQVCPVPIRAATSSAAASPRKMSPVQNTNPDALQRSSRGPRICFSSPGGIPGISRCDESRFACRAFPALRISHAPTLLSCAVPASPMPVHGSFRTIRLLKFQTRVRAAPPPDSEHGTPGTSALLLPWRPVSRSAPSVRQYLRSTPGTRGCVCPG